MRSCQVFKNDWTGLRVDQKPRLVLEGAAIFHTFSVDYEELQNGVGQFPVAIVEFPDGSLASRHVDLIRFNEPVREVM